MTYFARTPDDDDPTGTPPSATDAKTFIEDDWIRTVFKTADTPLRTHRITLSYSKFAEFLDETLFDHASVHWRNSHGRAIRAANANWFNFATWGTYTLGPNIRNDGAPQRLDTLPDSIRRRVAPSIVQSRSADGELVGRALAWGQELIFLSAAKALLRFKGLSSAELKTTFVTPAAERAHITRALNWSGQRWIDNGHLDLVDEAFDCYRLVRRRLAYLRRNPTSDPTNRGSDAINRDPYVVKLLFLATILLTAAEQAVVDQALSVVINSVPSRVLKTVNGQVSRFVHWRRDWPQQAAAYNLLARLRATEGAVNDVWARLMTSYLLVIVLPTEILRLGRDVPLRNPTSQMFPDPLMDLSIASVPFAQYNPRTDRGRARELLNFLMDLTDALDRSQDGEGSAARDWRRFDDRMNWAISLFRSRQQDTSLFWPPYSVEDTRRIIEGVLPRASGHPGHGSVMPPLDPASV